MSTMNNETKTKSKVRLIIWAVIYFLLIISVCVSFIMVFHSYYYRSIFVSGSSMEPTLNGNVSDRVDYGVIDDHEYALKSLKRFQIVTTYYPFKDSHDYKSQFVKGGNNELNPSEASYKIKRLYALPGETFKFYLDDEMVEKALLTQGTSAGYSEESQYYARKAIKFAILNEKTGEFVEQKIKFKRKINIQKFSEYDNFTYTLGEEEYWVMGDNYSASSDCFSKKAPVYYENFVGVLIAIEGTCKIQGNIIEGEDGTKTSYKCVNRKRHLPTYY